MITYRPSESIYLVTKRPSWFESFDYDEQWAGTADAKILELAHDFQIESNRNGRLEFESNLEASQVPIAKVAHTRAIKLKPN